MEKETLFAEIEFNVEFYDVDSMDVVWHGNYIKYFEKARCALLNRIGFGYLEMRKAGYAFPVTAISAKYLGSLRFGERARARAILEEYENGLKIRYEIYDALTGELRVKGSSTQMAVEVSTGTSLFVCPEIFIKKVESLLSGN
jgi:acyl-CoA thioester hydrolase